MNIHNQFDKLVGEQLVTMEKLLFVQSEIERCQKLQQELTELQDTTKIESIQNEINQMKKELHEIQKTFERQTEEVIKTYQIEHI